MGGGIYIFTGHPKVHMVNARNLRMHLPYESCEKKFTMREIYSISCMKEGNVQINYLYCRMVCCTPFPEQSLEEPKTEKNVIFG